MANCIAHDLCSQAESRCPHRSLKLSCLQSPRSQHHQFEHDSWQKGRHSCSSPCEPAGPQLSIIETFLPRCNRTATPKCLHCKTSGQQLVHWLGHQNCLFATTEPARQCFCPFQAQHPSNVLGSTTSAPNNTCTHRGGWLHAGLYDLPEYISNKHTHTPPHI